ncbi:hypothetical protein QJS04_geneDACA009630 [Acorus gramineus]|uniref:Polygalacturonase n=1 Tax=Acorus gramineus TaxID=55184 RepID=A0AAV9B8Z7_ACOGR|nr:hypothetical protein QJS04_geneDACA009630 [Acorus gramineus]
MNGVRIKTWQGGQGYAKNIVFQNIFMNNTKNSIIIDQNYCDSNHSCHDETSAVEVSEVLYNNIRGTSATDMVVDFDCSASVPCRAVVLEDIHLEYHNNKGKARTVFNNIDWSQKGEFYIGPGSGDDVSCCGPGSTSV